MYTGRCLCGDVRYQAQPPATSLCYCHCESCRRATGAPFVAWGTFEAAKFTITHGKLNEWRSSSEVTRGFCGGCGTAITYSHARRNHEVDLTLVTLDDPGVLIPVAHIWVRDKLPWVHLGDGLPQHGTVPDHEF